jgi:hypothetical protein
MSEKNINSVKRGVESSNNGEKWEKGAKNGESLVEREEKHVWNVKKKINLKKRKK